MHNFWVRANTVVLFALSVLMAMATMCAMSTYLHTGVPDVKVLKVNSIKTLRNHGGVDRALLYFDVHADLRPAWHWNLKQLFVYVVAEYESDANPVNQVVIWDKIVESSEDAVLKIKKQPVKYALIDQGAELRNKEVSLKLKWDHMPFTGGVYQGEGLGSNYTFPAKYVLKEA